MDYDAGTHHTKTCGYYSQRNQQSTERFDAGEYMRLDCEFSLEQLMTPTHGLWDKIRGLESEVLLIILEGV